MWSKAKTGILYKCTIFKITKLIFNTFMSSLFPHTHAQKIYTSPFNGWGEQANCAFFQKALCGLRVGSSRHAGMHQTNTTGL